MKTFEGGYRLDRKGTDLWRNKRRPGERLLYVLVIRKNILALANHSYLWVCFHCCIL